MDAVDAGRVLLLPSRSPKVRRPGEKLLFGNLTRTEALKELLEFPPRSDPGKAERVDEDNDDYLLLPETVIASAAAFLAE